MQSQKIPIRTFRFTVIEPFMLKTFFLLLSLENLFIFRFITMRVLKFTVKASILATPRGYHDPENVHFPPVNEDTCSPGSEMPMMGGHDRCRGTLVFPLSELFVEGVKMPLKVKNALQLLQVPRFSLLCVDMLLFIL